MEQDNGLGDLDNACGTFFCEKIRVAKNQRVLGGHGIPSQPGTLQYLFIEYLNRQEIPIPKGRFDLKESILRTLVQLGLAEKVRSFRGRNGWEYSGITTSPSLGSAIERRIPPEVTLLSEYPVNTWLFENEQLMSFNGEVIDDPWPFSTQQGGNKAFTSQAQKLSSQLFSTKREDQAESIGAYPPTAEYTASEEAFVPISDRYGAQMSERVHPGARHAVLSLEMSIKSGLNSHTKARLSGLLRSFEEHFKVSSLQLAESLELTIPSVPVCQHLDLSSRHPYDETYERLRDWLVSIPILIPDMIRRLNLLASSIGPGLYKELSLVERSKKKEGVSHTPWFLSNREVAFPFPISYYTSCNAYSTRLFSFSNTQTKPITNTPDIPLQTEGLYQMFGGASLVRVLLRV